ncbi:MAG: hypothetical protein K2O23_03775, partial [Anaeroplasmataceae bacterium]|nr:hypothetical protein [Anaeroplasmataceae bacterium]
LKVTYKKLLKNRKREFMLLKKIGFSDKTIYMHMISPLFISTFFLMLASGFIYLVRPFIIWYYYVIPLVSMVLLLYFVCKAIRHQYYEIMR